MTHDEFYDISTWTELFDACSDVGSSACDDYVGYDIYCEWIEDNLVSWAREYSWHDLLGKLTEYDENSGYDVYVWDSYYSEYRPADDDDFEAVKEELEQYIGENELWDDEPDEEEEQEDESTGTADPADPEDEEPTPDEDLSLGEMFTAGIGCIRLINEEALERARQQEKDFADLNPFVF